MGFREWRAQVRHRYLVAAERRNSVKSAGPEVIEDHRTEWLQDEVQGQNVWQW